MTLAVLPRDTVLHSSNATWTAGDWEQLPNDGQRFEIIAGVLYMYAAPIGLFMPGCDPVQPDILAPRAADRRLIGLRRIERVPALLVEVLSPSNADYDLMACSARQRSQSGWRSRGSSPACRWSLRRRERAGREVG